jgi:hypothetical protein
MAQMNPGTVRAEPTEMAANPKIEQVEATVVDPHAQRRFRMYKLQQGLYLLFGVTGALIAMRLVLRLLGANPAAPFVSELYGVTGPLVAPFAGIFGATPATGMVLEAHSIVALVVYALLAWLLVKLAWLLFGETRTGLTSTTTTVQSSGT